MNELELFTASLKDLGLSKDERIKRIKEWKISNKPLDVKEEKPIDLKVETEISEEINQDIDPVKPAKTNVSTSADIVRRPVIWELTSATGLIMDQENSTRG